MNWWNIKVLLLICSANLIIIDIIVGKTFVEFSRAVQLTVVHELMVRETINCEGYCDIINSDQYFRWITDLKKKEHWTPKMICRGRMSDCKDLEDTEICEFVSVNLINDNIIRRKY